MKKTGMFILALLMVATTAIAQNGVADSTYLDSVKTELKKQWPANKTVNIVFHGHSVPSGYARTPDVKTLVAYPHLTLAGVSERYPYAVVNVIVTAIGGENAEAGAKRFEHDVLTHQPTVIHIDYSLNDRGIGLERARKAWTVMIEAALKHNIPVILHTPTPDLSEDILDDRSPLAQHAAQVRELAATYHTGLVEAYATFKRLVQHGASLTDYMAQVNHPNEKGHRVVAEEIMKWYGGIKSFNSGSCQDNMVSIRN